MPKARALAATAAAALALLAGACSADGPASPAPTATDRGVDSEAHGGTPDPCTLLTFDDLSAALGETYTETKELSPGNLPGQRTCSFTPDSEIEQTECLTVAGCATSTVTVGVWPAQADQVDGVKAQAGQVTDLDGLGEVAFGEPKSVWAFTGSYMVNVRLYFIEVESIDPVSSLTRAAVARAVAA